MLYIVCTRDHHNLEKAFKNKEDAELYLFEMWGHNWRRRFNIIPVELHNED